MWRVVRIALVVCLGVVLLAMILEDQLIFVPSKFPEGNWRPSGLNQEDAWFQSADGTKLHGWYVAHKNPRAFVLFCHGNAGNITHREHILRKLARRGGRFGARSSITAAMDGAKEGPTRRASWPTPGRPAAGSPSGPACAEKRIVLMGESLGGAVAVDLAADGGARGLILESTFSSLADVAAYHFPWLPVRWFLHTKLNAAQSIKRYHGPLLETHGDRDRIVPYQFGRRLFEAANEPKQFITIPGGDHNDLRDRAYYEKVRAFVEGLP